MRTKPRTWLPLLAGASLFLAQPLLAQQQEPPAAPSEEKKPAVTAQAADQTPPPATNEVSETTTQPNEPEVNWGPPVISIGKDVEVKTNQNPEAVVVIGANAKVHGKVHQAVVVIGGDLELDGQVGDAVVAVFGNIDAKAGAKVYGEAVAVGGTLDVADGASVPNPQVVPIPSMRWLVKYFTHCVLLARPLAPEIGWVWLIAGIYFLVYLLVAAIFPSPVSTCVNELTRRPATTFLMGLMTKLLVPVVILILGVTGVGLLVVPFLVAALFLGAIIGKVALFEWIGLRLGKHFGEATQKPLAAFVLGSIVIAILYCIPFLGLMMLLVVSVWGLGVAVTAAFGGFRREIPEKRPTVPAAVPVYQPAPAMAAAAFVPAGAGAGGTPPGPASDPFANQPPTATLAPEPPVMPDALNYPRASFWERLGAGFLDFVLIGIITGMVHHAPIGMIVALAYFSGMWAWKGTTVGGIVLGLKVVRLDGHPVTFPVALVRALAGGFSIIVLFLGFLWIAWDREKQGWHDRIAGTVVLRLPRGTPLI